MTAPLDATGRHASARPVELRILAVIVAAQAGWIAYLCSRGWFYQDDFTLLSQALRHHLSLGYLRMPYNGHLTPGVRLVYWVLARTSKLHYPPTIVLRVALQAIATVLLYRLLAQLARSQRTALVITAIYAASPLLVPGTLWLASSINLLPAQLCVLVVYLAHLRHLETGRLRWSAVVGVALLVGVGFWEKTAITAVVLVVLTVGWLSTGSVRHRVGGLLRDWRGWVLALGPLALFTVYFFSHAYGGSAHRLAAHTAAHLIWLQWSHSLWAAVIGAPWQWLSGGDTFAGVADPQRATVVAGQVAFVLLVVAGWWRNRTRGALAWLIPLVSVAAGEVLIGIGRYAAFGDLVGLQFSYALDLAVPTAIAAALAFGRPAVPAAGRAELSGETAESAAERLHPRRRVLLGAVGVLLVLALIGSSVVSARSWTSRWHRSPAHSYVTAIVTGVKQIGPTANLFDTDVSPRVMPTITRNRRLSDLLALTDAHVGFDRGPDVPQLVTGSGRIVPASFDQVAAQIGAPNTFCPTLVAGGGSLTVPLAPTPPRGAYFLRIEYFEQRPALVRVTVRDTDGHVVGPRGPRTIDFDQKLGAVVLPLKAAAPLLVTFTSTSSSTSVCMSKVTLGVPTPATS